MSSFNAWNNLEALFNFVIELVSSATTLFESGCKMNGSMYLMQVWLRVNYHVSFVRIYVPDATAKLTII